MNIHLANHHGMCFGVRDALRATHSAAMREPVTMLGQLVHNPIVDAHLRTLGVRSGSLDQPAETTAVIITAHGVSDTERRSWTESGHHVTDTTCPLVCKAHQALVTLVEEGYHPVVIGQRLHVEVRGLVGDFPMASVLQNEAEAALIAPHAKLGVISQTTQPLERVLQLVQALKETHPHSEVRFIDTVCHPTKQRQTALEDLCRRCEIVIIIGGKNSNNTRQLTEKASRLGVRAHQIEAPDDLQEEWFTGFTEVGVTAGTSTLDETVAAVMERLRQLSA